MFYINFILNLILFLNKCNFKLIMGNCCECNKDNLASISQIKEGNDVQENNKNNAITEEDINYIPSSPTDQRLNTYETHQKNSLFNLQKNSIYTYNQILEDKPDVLDEVLGNANSKNFDDSLNESKNDDNQFSVSLISMEKKLFEIINDLRENPKSFICKVEGYKKKLQKNNDSYFILIDDNIFQFQKGPEDFDECIIFLKNQKRLQKFEQSPSMFEAKTLFQDKNVSDLYFVLIYNLIDANSKENEKTKRNCIMSELYYKLNITITKNDFLSNLYTFYFSFDD